MRNPLRAAVRGAIAGAAGTVAMDLVWYVRYRRDGGEQGFSEWEWSAGTAGFEQAGTPAKVGRRLVEELVHIELPDSAAGTTNNVVHWATGVSWGAAYGVAAALGLRPGLRSGLLLGVLACSTSYAVLPVIELYKPIWGYDVTTLARDYSAHLAFGTATGASLWLLHRRP